MNNTYHLISNTHWDREWRFPFQRNRQMLTDMMDAVLEILENNPDYSAYHLDSQSIVLKDYLEVKPQNKERITKLVQDNRLLIGPWYILPDQFQVGGENHVRNLLLGHQVCAEHGGVSKIGYSPFSWGQISQLPQLYKEFNIDLIMFYRGVNALESPKSEFLWEGADGTRMVSSRFSTMPRYNFYFYIYRNVVHNEDPWNVEYKWSKGGTPFHFADQQQQEEDFFIVAPLDEYHEENIEPWVNRLREEQDDDFTTPHKIWMEGHDSSGPNAKTARIVKDIKEKMGLDVRHSTLLDYAQSIAESVKEDELSLVTGERRSAQANHRSGNMYGYTTSARMYLKQVNFEAERWAQFYAEPFNIFSGLEGRDIRDQYMEMAWEKILQNAAHDSIGGCSLDAIHEDMMHRYKEVIEISKGVFERAMKYSVVKLLNTDRFIDPSEEQLNDKVFLTAVNPNNSERSEIVEAYLDIPKEFDQGYFEIVDVEGNIMPFQLIERKEAQHVLEQMTNRPMYFDMVRYKTYVQLKDLPKFGMKTFRIRPIKDVIKKVTAMTKFEQGRMYLENDYLKVGFNENGTIDVFHKATETTYKELGYLYDEGEAGHAWTNVPTDPIITTLNAKPRIVIQEDGSLSSTIRVEHQLELHKTLKDRKEGNNEKVIIPVHLLITLKADSEQVDFRIKLDNQAESHRLRVMFPTELSGATHSYGEGQFDVVERTLDRPDTSDWVEQPMYDFPMHQFVDVTDGDKGCAVLVDGLKEYEVLADEKKTLAITLIRAFEFIINPAAEQDYTHEKGAQCLGKQEFRFAFYPHKGNWEEGKVYSQALNFNNAIRLIQTGQLNGEGGPEVKLLDIENEQVVFSALKKTASAPDDSKQAVLRVYNPTTTPQTTKVSMKAKIQAVTLTSLEELEKETLEVNDNSFTITLEPKKIGTVKLQFS
ncbi:alpha-mannosidase [Algivirga pacifica]|uniref:Mannosylglycerate hydrolase n=1 Tax=Algivirga pacifica TaxID=1162670 RepID=A0ABP9D5Y3_9BACT